MSCPVQFCRKNCPVLPEETEVFRASGQAICTTCGKTLYKHVEYAYPTGQGHCVKSCDGVFYHL